MKFKSQLLILFAVFSSFAFAQTYPSLNMSLLSLLTPETDNTGFDGRKYSGCWGWYQANKGKEYALVGTSAKTYFIDVTNPLIPVICDSVMGKHAGCTWRELKTYQNYCYIVSDDAAPNSFQIVDMQYLPDSVHVVHDANTYFERGHTVWIDGTKMYVGGMTYSTSTVESMAIFSLATPTAPVQLRTLSQDYPSIGYVHDMFVINDTVFASCGNQGLYVFKYNTVGNTFTQLGSFTGYTEAGYNHSSYITTNRQTLVFCDEAPTGLSIKFANVSNLNNITLSALAKPNTNPQMVAHNPYVLGNNYAFVSCYQDGLILYDISSPTTPTIAGYFDTHPQGGANAGNNYGASSYRGNWGAYPYLPSGLIIACDMQNGIFLLQANAVTGNVTGIKERGNSMEVHVYPNPAGNFIQLSFVNPKSDTYQLEIRNVLGQLVHSENNTNDCSFPVTFKRIDVTGIESGTYILHLQAGEKQFQEKIIITK
jgi:choice-of-anchor B domain-containing protein